MDEITINIPHWERVETNEVIKICRKYLSKRCEERRKATHCSSATKVFLYCECEYSL